MALPGLLTQAQGVVNRVVAAASSLTENSGQVLRTDRRGELYGLPLLNGLQAAAQEGSYFAFTQEGVRNTGVNLTAGTGTTYLATQALLLVANTNQLGGPDIILDYLTIKIDAVITGGTAWHLYHAMDTGNRYSSGGALMTGYAVNGGGGNPSGVLAYTGVLTATAATGSVRDVGYNLLLNGVGVAQMILTLKFGAQDANPGTFTTPTTGVAQTVIPAPPIVIQPGWSYVLNEFQTARSATGVGEFFMGAYVR